MYILEKKLNETNILNYIKHVRKKFKDLKNNDYSSGFP